MTIWNSTCIDLGTEYGVLFDLTSYIFCSLTDILLNIFGSPCCLLVQS